MKMHSIMTILLEGFVLNAFLDKSTCDGVYFRNSLEYYLQIIDVLYHTGSKLPTQSKNTESSSGTQLISDSMIYWQI